MVLFVKRGKEYDGSEATFPIVGIKDGKLNSFGTGFYIHPWGGFVSAKHLFDELDYPVEDLRILHRSGSQVILRKVESVHLHPEADVCVGMAVGLKQGNNRIRNEYFGFDLGITQINTTVYTLAYPKSYVDIHNSELVVKGDIFAGLLKEHCERCPTVRIITECYLCNFEMLGGSSGGPVFGQNGRVIGINSVSYGLDADNAEPISFVTPIKYALEVQIKVEEYEYVLLRELLYQGYIEGY